MAGMASLHEVKYSWTIDELMDANDLLDIKEDAEAEQLEKMRA